MFALVVISTSPVVMVFMLMEKAAYFFAKPFILLSEAAGGVADKLMTGALRLARYLDRIIDKH